MVIGTDVADIAVQNDGATQQTALSYATVDDLRRTLRKPIPGASADDGELSKQDWIDALLDAEDQIDRACNTSWRARRVELEYHDWDEWVDEQFFMRIQLQESPVKAFDANLGDEFQVWDGASWVDFLATKTEGRNEDWWLQEPEGFVHIRRSLFPRPFGLTRARSRFSYRYGESQVPRDIRKACRLIAAADIASQDALSVGGFGGDVDRVQTDPKINKWLREAAAILAHHQHVGVSY